jgi:ABC-type ATPase involved in cell division
MLSVDVEKRLKARSRASATRDGEFTVSARFATATGVTALFGPSGAGKTTLVNMIAGLVTPDRGRIAIADTVLFDSKARINVPAHQRRIGYVFQEGRLFPHLSVASNLDYGRRVSGLPADPAETKRIVELLDIAHLIDRRPGKLSGGERQRIAVGRALLMRANARSCPTLSACATRSRWSMSAITPASCAASQPRWCGSTAGVSRRWAERNCSKGSMLTRCEETRCKDYAPGGLQELGQKPPGANAAWGIAASLSIRVISWCFASTHSRASGNPWQSGYSSRSFAPCSGGYVPASLDRRHRPASQP